MRHPPERRRVAAGMYAGYSAVLVAVAWASLSVLPLLAAFALMAVAVWALRGYPIDRDW